MRPKDLRFCLELIQTSASLLKPTVSIQAVNLHQSLLKVLALKKPKNLEVE